MNAVENKNGRLVREAHVRDVDAVMPVVAAAKGIMRASGNMLQWAGEYPSREVIMDDVERGVGRVMEDDGVVVAYFAMLPSPDPTYARIYGGQWLDDERPYLVVHRIASVPHAHGVFAHMVDYCWGVTRNLRIDTHRDNHIMQHNLLKHGFTYCGIIYLLNGDERLAYQRIEL